MSSYVLNRKWNFSYIYVYNCSCTPNGKRYSLIIFYRILHKIANIFVYLALRNDYTKLEKILLQYAAGTNIASLQGDALRAEGAWAHQWKNIGTWRPFWDMYSIPLGAQFKFFAYDINN